MGLFNIISNAAKEVMADAAQSAIDAIASAADAMTEATNTNDDEKVETREDMPSHKVYLGEICLNRSSDEVFIVDPIVGKSREFELSGIKFEIPAKLDAYNQYRTALKRLQADAYDNFLCSYQEVKDTQSFFEIVPREYDKNLYVLLKTALSYLIAENIWDVTYGELAVYYEKNSSIAQEWGNFLELIELSSLSENDEQFARDVEDDFVRLCKPSQKLQNRERLSRSIELSPYEREKISRFDSQSKPIEHSVEFTEGQLHIMDQVVESFSSHLLPQVQNDYENVAEILVSILHRQGVAIWWPNDAEKTRANKVLTNLHNAASCAPNALKALTEVILADPYDETVYAFMEDKIENKEQVEIIKRYFGV